MSHERVYVGLGGNLGDSSALFRSAISQIETLEDTRVHSESSLYKTPPMGPDDQADYSNMVLALDTNLSPISLLDALQNIEQDHGRIRKDEQWGERTLDLDILLFGDRIIDEQRLRVPHYGMAKRSFVIVPLHELVGSGFTLPQLGEIDKVLISLANDPISNLGKLK